jgi:hypothetical protein
MIQTVSTKNVVDQEASKISTNFSFVYSIIRFFFVGNVFVVESREQIWPSVEIIK